MTDRVPLKKEIMILVDQYVSISCNLDRLAASGSPKAEIELHTQLKAVSRAAIDSGLDLLYMLGHKDGS